LTRKKSLIVEGRPMRPYPRLDVVALPRIHSGLLLIGDVGFGVGSPGCGSAAVIV
jgi:hypothetical protein